jgi:hypothetical protein
MDSFSQQLFIEHLVCVRDCSCCEDAALSNAMYLLIKTSKQISSQVSINAAKKVKQSIVDK